MNSKTNTEAIYREAQTLRRLRHPNIVRCFIYHKFKNSIFIGILSSFFDLSWPLMTFRDRTRAIKNFKLLTGPDQYQEKFQNLRLDRTRTEKIFQISDQTGPGQKQFWKSRIDSDRSVHGPSGRWISARNHSHLESSKKSWNIVLEDRWKIWSYSIKMIRNILKVRNPWKFRNILRVFILKLQSPWNDLYRNRSSMFDISHDLDLNLVALMSNIKF